MQGQSNSRPRFGSVAEGRPLGMAVVFEVKGQGGASVQAMAHLRDVETPNASPGCACCLPREGKSIPTCSASSSLAGWRSSCPLRQDRLLKSRLPRLVVRSMAWQTGQIHQQPVAAARLKARMRANPSLNHPTLSGMAPRPQVRAVHLRPCGRGAMPATAG
jgi:hypothetical protein